jgi:hypothetical protein
MFSTLRTCCIEDKFLKIWRASFKAFSILFAHRDQKTQHIKMFTSRDQSPTDMCELAVSSPPPASVLSTITYIQGGQDTWPVQLSNDLCHLFTACRSLRCLTDLRITVTLSPLARGRFVRVLHGVAKAKFYHRVHRCAAYIFYTTLLRTMLHLLINYLSYWITVVDVGQISRTKRDNIYAGVQLPPSLVSRRKRQLVTI